MWSGKSQLQCWDCTDWPQGTWDLGLGTRVNWPLVYKGPQELSWSLSQKLFWNSNRVPCFIILVFACAGACHTSCTFDYVSRIDIWYSVWDDPGLNIRHGMFTLVEYVFVWRTFESLCNHVFLVCSRLNKNLYHWQTQHIWNVANCKHLQLAATVAFLIARYLARDRILKLAKDNKKFLAIDKAIGADGFRVVTLLRLSPLLPFSLGNYLYGLTSVQLGPYVLGRYRD